MLIVKRKGHTEKFDQRKLYASVYAACLTLVMAEEEAELISLKVMQNVIDELKDQNEVNSSTIYEIAHRELETFHPEAAYMYANHYDVN